MLADVAVEGDRIKHLVVCNKSGLSEITADHFVDATGDGDLSSRAGIPFEMGREGDHATQADDHERQDRRCRYRAHQGRCSGASGEL